MNIIVVFLLLCGLIFFAGGAVGIIRFPDFYSRLHPGKTRYHGLSVYAAGSGSLKSSSFFSGNIAYES